MAEHFVIGDVHGEFDTLLALVSKLPSDARLYFVGDLVDRGPASAEVVEYVRKNAAGVVMGNHEAMMLQYAPAFLQRYPDSVSAEFMHNWAHNGGDDTLMSYALMEYDETDMPVCVRNDEGVKRLRSDLEWMQGLALYLHLDLKIKGRDVVISHASCSDVWYLRDNTKEAENFRDHLLWSRSIPKPNSDIFNVYGHTPVEFGVELGEHYANVDTGCYIRRYGYGMLSALCLETLESISVHRV